MTTEDHAEPQNEETPRVRPTLGGLENPPPPETGRDKLVDPREENVGEGRSLGDRRMGERAAGGEGGGQPYDHDPAADGAAEHDRG